MSQFPKILLAEDNPNDIELTLRSLREHNLADSVFVACDGATALDYVFGTGAFVHRNPQDQPTIIST